VEPAEAEAVYDAGREVVVEVLLRMDAQIRRLEERVAGQDDRIAQLERRLNRNSRNSSAPPSSDPPKSASKRGKDSSGRRRGAQPGHEGSGRELLPACAVDEVIEYWPERCDCGHVFSGDERRPVGEPARHQIEELPAMTVKVLEHRAQRVRCPRCGARARVELSDEAISSAFGPRLRAAVAVLSVRNRVSRRDVVELMEELFCARISTGTVDAILARAGEALAEPYEDLLARVRGARTLNMDETGWRTAGERRALWGAFTPRHALFAIAADRHEDHAKSLLAHTEAIVTSDRWWAYAHLPLARRQLCWSHLKRDFAAHAEGLAAE
jgi:transposase